jgi:sulfoxide reductase catalytic subunit YedY
MANIHIPKTWEIPEREVTPEAAYINRRRFLTTLAGAGLSIAGGSILGYPTESEAKTPPQIDPNLMKFESVERNPAFAKVDRPITDEAVAAKYNNYYEFGSSKSIWEAAQALPTENWKVEVLGLVRNPRTYDLDDLKKKFPLEERVYRFRCVEAWAMVVPWFGFPMKRIIDDVEPTSEARFVRFISYYNRKITKGPGLSLSRHPWPYTEGLRTDEMANDLAFFAIGIYGHELPKQHGAPIREVVPWKYGFKGAKSIVKIEFLNHQPKTFWNTLQPSEYGFEANVEPDVPHPRWSQASERMIGSGPSFMWDRRDTLLYNGYAEYVAHLYDR